MEVSNDTVIFKELKMTILGALKQLDNNGNCIVVPMSRICDCNSLTIAADYIMLIRKFGISPFGMMINIFTAIVLSSTSLQKNPLTPYLLIMAVNNGIYLLLDMVGEIVFRLDAATVAYCKIMMYLAVATASQRNFLVAAMSLNKTIAIIKPFQAFTIIRRKTTISTLAATTVITFSIYLTCLWEYGLVDGWCQTLQKYQVLVRYEVVLSMVETVSCFALIFICTIICVHGLSVQQTKMKQNKSMRMDYDQVSLMLLCSMVLYLVTTFPSATYTAIRQFVTIPCDIDHFVFALVLVLHSLGISNDFFFYIGRCQLFRKRFKAIFCKYSCVIRCSRFPGSTSGADVTDRFDNIVNPGRRPTTVISRQDLLPSSDTCTHL